MKAPHATRASAGNHDVALCGLFVVLTLALFVLSSCGAHQAPVKADGAETGADTSTVKVAPQVAQAVEIQNEAVTRRRLATTLHVTGQIHPDIGKEVHVSARFSGRVLEVLVIPGEMVLPGKVLATVDSHEISELQAELIEARAKLSIAEAHEERERQIYEEQLQRPKSLIQAKTHFDETKVQLELAESEFHRQEGLYKEKIASAKAYLVAKADLAKAKAAYAQALVDLQREERLYANKALMRRDYQLAEAETARARQHFNTLQQRLSFLGMPPPMLHQLVSTGKILAVIPIASPAAGIVTNQAVAAGEVIEPGKPLFTITDLASVVVRADIPEVDVQRVRIGSQVRVRIASYPDKTFEGTISYMSDVVNPETRTVAIRARLPNPQRLLKSNMFAECDIEGEPALMLACPKSAVQERDGKKVVYVLTADGYRERPIDVGADTEAYYQVLSGLGEGERVATQGSLMLKTELSYQH